MGNIEMGFDLHMDLVQLLSPSGEISKAASKSARDIKRLVGFYRAMTRTRIFDNKAISLQRTGQLGTFASALGQEAIGVGAAAAMEERDVLVPSYRDHAAQFYRGMAMSECLLYWGGDERGSDFKNARSDFPNCVPVATQAPQAVGAAYALMARKEDRVVVTFIGDGGTSNGAFYEALNMAGVWKTPVVFIINNNGWAISTPRELESAAETLAQKAVAAGIEGRQVDGNDVIAVHEVVRRAIDKARSGGGPTLIEALTYRLGDHTTADDASRYRDPEVVRAQWTREPIARLRAYLVSEGAWSKEQEAELHKECAEEVDREVAAYLHASPLNCDAMFEHLYAKLPDTLQWQREEARRFAQRSANGNGNGHG